MTTRIERSVRASDRAHVLLRADIVEWRLTPGSLLAEVEQAERLGVSRTRSGKPCPNWWPKVLPFRRGVAASSSPPSPSTTSPTSSRCACRSNAAVRLAAASGPARHFAALAGEFQKAAVMITADDGGQDDYYALTARLDQAVDEAAANSYLLQARTPIRTHLLRIRRLARDSRDCRDRCLASAREHEQAAAGTATATSTTSATSTDPLTLHQREEHHG